MAPWSKYIVISKIREVSSRTKSSARTGAASKRRLPSVVRGRPRPSTGVSARETAASTFFSSGRTSFPECSTFEKLETLEGLHRRHGATAKLTYGLVSMHMSGRPSIAVTSGVCRKLHYGAEATIVKFVIAVRAAARPRCQPPGQYYSFDQKCKSYVS